MKTVMKHRPRKLCRSCRYSSICLQRPLEDIIESIGQCEACGQLLMRVGEQYQAIRGLPCGLHPGTNGAYRRYFRNCCPVCTDPEDKAIRMRHAVNFFKYQFMAQQVYDREKTRGGTCTSTT